MQQISFLLNDGAFKSALICSDFYLTSEEYADSHAELQLLKGRALQGLKEYRRAIASFKLALEHSCDDSTNAQCQCRISMSQCFFELGDFEEALSSLESVDSTAFPLSSLLMQANLLERFDRVIEAIELLEQIVLANPFVLEASLSLLRLSAPQALVAQPHYDIAGLQTRLALTYKNVVVPQVELTDGSFQDSVDTFQWLEDFVCAARHSARFDYRAALDVLGCLETRFPDCLSVLVETASTLIQVGDGDAAREIFERIRYLDEFCFDKMDSYALLLRSRTRLVELHALAESLSVTNAQQAEGLLAQASYFLVHHDATGDAERAATLCDKVFATSPTHAFAHVVFGGLRLAQGQSEAAVVAFRRALGLNPRDFGAHQGLVDACLASSKFKDALFASKETLRLMPRNPRALALIGLVLSHAPDGREKARAAFVKALSMDSNCTDAVFALVKLETTEKKYSAAAELLKKHVLQHNSDFTHTRLANIYVLLGDAKSAVLHFHAALAQNASYQPAIIGLEQLETSLGA